MLSWPTGSTSEGNKTKRRLSLFKQLRPPQSVWEMGLTELELQHWYAWGMANVQTAIFLQRVYKVVFRGGRNDSLWACKQRWLLPAQHHHLLNPEPDQWRARTWMLSFHLFMMKILFQEFWFVEGSWFLVSCHGYVVMFVFPKRGPF